MTTTSEPTSHGLSDLPPPPPISPERAAYLRAVLNRTAEAVLNQLVADLTHSRDSSRSPASPSERLLATALRPLLPHIRQAFLARLAEADPASTERLLGAVAWAVEDLIAQAPGDPVPRHAFIWEPGAPVPHLVPADES